MLRDWIQERHFSAFTDGSTFHPMTVPLDGDGPLYRQIYRALRSEILGGRLGPGDRLPSTRALAADAGVSRNIAVLAYDQLLAEGYALARRGSGTVVAPLPEKTLLRPATAAPKTLQRSPKLAPAGKRVLELYGRGRLRWEIHGPRMPYDFRFGRPSFGDFPHATWCRLLGRRARRASIRDLDYGAAEGRIELREAIAERLRRLRGVDCDAERIVVVNGSQQALDLVARLLLAPGDGVLIEEPHYAGARSVFLAAGARLLPSPVDGDGMQVPRRKASGASPRLAYVTPSHQFPTGAVMPLARRLELLTWAEHHGVVIFEDDYDSEYRYGGAPVPALQGLDRSGLVIYGGTFSKLMFPALRLGYVVLPEALLTPMIAAKALADTGCATLEQLTLADFIREGHFDRHVRRS
ncbi:MAG: GntR family transcriptional regulator / MocR family aminotransferase, partial [Candidatus Binatota bacterium]|nr:GntR family transcriptional regulator / MocR family aminotransferase [Candidatus Binatota bacterium]